MRNLMLAATAAVLSLAVAGPALAAPPKDKAPTGCEWREGPVVGEKPTYPLHCKDASGTVVKADVGTTFVPGVIERAEAGEPRAMGLMAAFYANADPEAVRDYDVAYQWALKSAAKGDTTGMYMLAYALQHGFGVTKNPHEAVKWYRKSAEAGDTFSALALAIMLLDEKSGVTDQAEGLKWLTRASDGGEVVAHWQLGNLYHYGYGGVTADPAKALGLYRLAVKGGYWLAANDLCVLIIDEYQRTGQGDPGEALKACHLGVNKGDKRPLFHIGRLHLYGIGVPQDDREAAKWIRRGADNDDLNAIYFYGMMHIEGRGVPQNREEGIRLLQLAASKGHQGAIASLKELGVASDA